MCLLCLCDVSAQRGRFQPHWVAVLAGDLPAFDPGQVFGHPAQSIT
jgi:hypothetical protein